MTTDASGHVTFTLPFGDYRFRADKNGTQFWSGAENTCTLPGCAGDTVTTTIPVLVTVQDSAGEPEAGLPVYAFDGTMYSGYNRTTDASGWATFTLPLGNYRFLADKDGTQYWSDTENHCTLPGCTNAVVTTTVQAGLLGRGKTFAAPLPWSWNVAPQPDMTAPVPLQDNSSGVLVTRTITYTYDSLNRLTAADYSTGEQYVYQYDAVGNRTAYTLTTPLDGTAVTTYTYDAANRLLVADAPGRSVTYTWDARGNLLADGTFIYTYSAAGRMVRAESITATLVYTYNADSLRVAQSVDGAVTTFAWDWATGVPELLSDGESLYLIGYDTLGWQTDDGWTFVLPDALGSVRQETDAAGTVTAVREWSPYGEELGGAQAGLGFTGEWFDTGVGLQYLRARWYDGTTGRFTQTDPWSGDQKQPISLHPYLYVSNSPNNRVDPSGLIDPLIWAFALQGVSLPTPSCSSSNDFQPYANLHIRLGSPEISNHYSYDSEEAWNYAPAKVIQGVHLAIQGYLGLVGQAFVDRMGQVEGNRHDVTIVFAPPTSAGQRPHYVYPPDFSFAAIVLPPDVATSNSLIGQIVGSDTPQKVAGTVAHELTHIIAQKLLNCSQIESNYCYKVRGAPINKFQWETYQTTYFPIGPINQIVYCPRGIDIRAAPEAIANIVALYIVQSGNVPSHLTYADELSRAFVWVENYYRVQVISQ